MDGGPETSVSCEDAELVFILSMLDMEIDFLKQLITGFPASCGF